MRSWNDESRFTVHTAAEVLVGLSGRGGGEMIRQVDKSNYHIPMSGDPRLHRELTWYATDDDASSASLSSILSTRTIPGSYLPRAIEDAGYAAADIGETLPTEEDATAALHDAMRSVVAGNRRLVPMPVKRPRKTSPLAPRSLAAMKTWHAFAFLIVTAWRSITPNGQSR